MSVYAYFVYFVLVIQDMHIQVSLSITAPANSADLGGKCKVNEWPLQRKVGDGLFAKVFWMVSRWFLISPSQKSPSAGLCNILV